MISETQAFSVPSGQEIPSAQVCFSTHPMTVEDEGLLVRSQLHVGFAAGPSPAHPHVSPRHRLELEIPPARLHRVRALHAEEADLIDAQPLHHMTWDTGNGTNTAVAPKVFAALLLFLYVNPREVKHVWDELNQTKNFLSCFPLYHKNILFSFCISESKFW